MTVFKPSRGTTWRYDFWWHGERYEGSTDQLTKADAALVESDIKKRLRQQAWGIAPFERRHTPSFTEWAAYVLQQQRTRLTRPDLLARTLRAVLAFWGRRPQTKPVTGGVYHDLRLADPILDPEWIVKFEAWMGARGLAGSTKNSYRSACSMMYRLALRPAFRKKTSITVNPFLGVERDRDRRRLQTLTLEQLQAWIREAAPHVQLAIAIAALAPKLRLASILALRWGRHVDVGLQYITVYEHKTVASTGDPQVIPIDPQLRAILEPFWQRRRTSPSVISFRGNPVKSIRTALKRAARDAGLPYGIRGITFHSLRHTMATLLAELDVPEKKRQMVMGHSDIRTTQRYTHLRPVHERAPLAQLSAAVPIRQLFEGLVPDSRTGTCTGTRSEMGTDSERKTEAPGHRRERRAREVGT